MKNWDLEQEGEYPYFRILLSVQDTKAQQKEMNTWLTYNFINIISYWKSSSKNTAFYRYPVFYEWTTQEKEEKGKMQDLIVIGVVEAASMK